MKSSTKNLIRIFVFAALFAWPGVEGYRYWAAVQQLQASAERHDMIAVKLASLRSTQVAGQPAHLRKP